MGRDFLKIMKHIIKNYKLTRQNCTCTEEEMVTFSSTIKEGTGSNCCQFNPKSMSLFLSTPALFLLLYVKRCKHTDKTSLPLCLLTLKEPIPPPAKKNPQAKIEIRYMTQKQPTHPPILERKYFSSQVCHCCGLHNHVLKYWSCC